MALDYTQIQSITQEYIEPHLQDNIFDKTAVLNRLRNKMDKSQDGGEYIKVPILYAKKTSTGRYSSWGTLETAVNDSVNAVTYNWAHAYASMGISRTDELVNSGKSAIVKLITAEAKAAELTLADELTDDLFATSAVTNGIAGFPLMCHTTTDYGGISSSDFSGWAASRDTTSTVMTLGAIQGKFGDVSDGNEVPTLMISNQDMFDKYWQLLEVKPEFRVQKNNYIGLKFNAADWVVDKGSNGSGSGTEDNYLYFLNENFIKLYVHPKDNFKVGQWQKPINQEGRIARVTWTGQLSTNNRRRHGIMTAIDPAL
jgi:hypothetical protein